MGQDYYFPGHPSNAISSCAIKFYVEFQQFKSENIEHCDFVDPQGINWRSPYYTQNNLDYLQIEICQSQTSKRQKYGCPNFMFSIKTNISQLIHQRFVHVSITRLNQISRKGLMEVLPTKLIDLD